MCPFPSESCWALACFAGGIFSSDSADSPLLHPFFLQFCLPDHFRSHPRHWAWGGVCAADARRGHQPPNPHLGLVGELRHPPADSFADPALGF
jgi:hypothetical protein